MAGPEALRRAALALAGHMQAGLPLDANSLRVVLQTLGESDPARALALLAADPESSDAAPLLALVYSPGAATRRALEPALSALDGPEDQAEGLASGLAGALARTLAGRPTRLLLPDGRKLALSPREEDLFGLAMRLRPGATAPLELRGVLARRLAGAGTKGADKAAEADLALDLAVLLRHCRLAWTQGQLFFLSTLLQRAEADDDLRGLAAWAVGFLDLAAAPVHGVFSPASALAARRQALLLQLRQAEAQEMALGRSSFELRMSQGQRLGHVHGPDVRAELALLDRAGELVLGRTGQAQTQDSVRVLDLGRAQTVDDLLRLMPVHPSSREATGPVRSPKSNGKARPL